MRLGCDLVLGVDRVSLFQRGLFGFREFAPVVLYELRYGLAFDWLDSFREHDSSLLSMMHSNVI